MEGTMEHALAELMEGREFPGKNLSGASLGGADLRGRNFRGADLSHAHLGAADLSGADLRNADLSRANLGAARLVGADLRYADLREANLKGADLTGADLRECRGLDTEAPVDLRYLIRPCRLEETEEFASAKNSGYHPLAHWGKEYALSGKTLYKNETVWLQLKKELGDSIFGDRKIFSEVKLVQQYKEYSQWAYMISKRGFLRIAGAMGIKVRKKA